MSDSRGRSTPLVGRAPGTEHWAIDTAERTREGVAADGDGAEGADA